MESEDLDIEAIVEVTIIGILIICAVVFLFISGIHQVQQQKLSPYTEKCSVNPLLRYGQNCTTSDDCINRCAQRLYDLSLNSSSV